MKSILILTVALLTFAACGGQPEPQPVQPVEEQSKLEREADRAASLVLERLERELEKERERD